jgi:hypothetical protein
VSNFASILQMVLRRSVANWKALTTVVVGVILSAALMSSVIVYSDAIRDLGLAHTLEDIPPRELDLQVTSSSQPTDPTEYLKNRDALSSLVRGYAGGILARMVRSGKSATFFPTAPGQAVSEEDGKPRANFHFVERLSEHVRVVEGDAPTPATMPADHSAPTIEAWLSKATAQASGTKVGDSFELHPFWRPEIQPIKVTVAGLIEPADASEEYWFGRENPLDNFTVNWTTFPFFVSEDTFPAVLGAYLPDMDTDLEVDGFVELGRINSRNAQDVENRLKGLRGALASAIPHTAVQSRLPETIEEFRTKLFFTRLPLFALMLQIVGIVLYYLVMVSTMLVERQAGEIALLRSRGASPRQILIVYALESGIYCGAAAILGPLVAAGAISILGTTPPFRDLSDGGLLDVTLSSGAFGMAALGAVLAFVAMLLPAYRAAGKSIVDYKHQLARPPLQPLFLRYYLDLVVIGAGALAFYELRQRGSLVTDKLFGGLSADPLLLASPTLFMLMIALVFLRLFPLGLRLAAWVSRGLQGPTAALGLSRMVRAPLHYSRLILLLLLATAVGMFAAGFGATLSRSYDDRAAYEAAAPQRITGVRNSNLPTAEGFSERIGRVTGATDVTAVARMDGSYSTTRFRTENLTLLAVDPQQFDEFAFWRDDFAGPSLDSLMSRLEQEPPTPAGRPIPVGTRWLGVWAQLPLPLSAAHLGVRLVDSNGVYRDYRMGTDPEVGTPGDWQFFIADLTRPTVRPSPGQPAPGQIRLDAVWVRLTGQPPQIPERISVLVDELHAAPESGLQEGWQTTGFVEGELVEDFEDMSVYETVAGGSQVAEPGSISRAEVPDRPGGRYAARIAFTRGGVSPQVVGLRTQGQTSFPVLVSRSFLSATKAKNGDEVTIFINRQYASAKIAGVFDLFPSYDPAGGEHFFVANLAAVKSVTTRLPGTETVYPNEAWMRGTSSDRLTREVLERSGIAADRAFDVAALRDEAARDPLVAASWEGILFLSFAAVLGLTALGFGVYVALAARARGLEFAILRTMGFSSRQVLSLVTFEQAFVIVAGIAAGTLLGFPLSRLMIGYLSLTESGKDPLPPLVAEVSWATVATVYALLALVFIATIAALARVYSRLAVHRALRIGEV